MRNIRKWAGDITSLGQPRPFLIALGLIFSTFTTSFSQLEGTLTQLSPIPNQVVKLKLVRQLTKEHFGIGASAGLKQVPGIDKALDYLTFTTFSPKKGHSMWIAEGGITVMISYEPKSGEPTPKEVWVEGVSTQNGINNLIAVLCCCNESQGNCQLRNTNGIIRGCSGGNCCGQTIGLVDPGGFVKILGGACKSDKTTPAPPPVERH